MSTFSKISIRCVTLDPRHWGFENREEMETAFALADAGPIPRPHSSEGFGLISTPARKVTGAAVASTAAGTT